MLKSYKDYTFLYVEDDPLSQQVMEMIMENAMGVRELVIFADSQNFLNRLQALPQLPDVILLDIHIHPIDGFDMLKQVRSLETFHETPIIALTASVMNEEVEKLRTVGFDGAIGKPLSVRTFPELMERVLNGQDIWHIA
jgi:two-component system, cell cycle response regulator DivK